MNIQYSKPFSQGFKRMKKALFQPFNLEKWFVVGFTAFLATLTDCRGNGGGSSSNRGGHPNWDELFRFPETARDWLLDHPLYFNLILAGVVLLVIIGIVFIWLSSRGKFMFLDNVVHDKAEVKKPWFEYRREGNSLFLWRLVFGLIVLAVFIWFLLYCFETAKMIHSGNMFVANKFWAITKLVLLFLAFILSVGFITMLLDHFVIPIMYKQKIPATKAWGRFLKLFGRYFGHFILYGCFFFVLGLGVMIGVIFLAALTCCIGFILLIIPFINVVVLLPVHYTFRAFSVEFLEQFGDEFRCFPDSETLNETAEPGTD